MKCFFSEKIWKHICFYKISNLSTSESKLYCTFLLIPLNFLPPASIISFLTSQISTSESTINLLIPCLMPLYINKCLISLQRCKNNSLDKMTPMTAIYWPICEYVCEMTAFVFLCSIDRHNRHNSWPIIANSSHQL